MTLVITKLMAVLLALGAVASDARRYGERAEERGRQSAVPTEGTAG